LVNLFVGRLTLKLFTQALAHVFTLRARGIFERSLCGVPRLRRFFRRRREPTGDCAAREVTRRAVGENISPLAAA
jgi:hypothetical protein